MKLLTQQDVAERWQVTVDTVTNYRKEGILQPCKNIPTIRFTEQHILALEGIRLDRLSPLERKRLEVENKQLKNDNERLRRTLTTIIVEANKIYMEV